MAKVFLPQQRGYPTLLRDVYEHLEDTFTFTIDASLPGLRRPFALHVTVYVDPFAVPSTGRAFCRVPATGRSGQWIAKGWHEALQSEAETVALLVPVRTGSPSWHQIVPPPADVYCLTGSGVLDGTLPSALLPWAVIVFDKRSRSAHVSTGCDPQQRFPRGLVSNHTRATQISLHNGFATHRPGRPAALANPRVAERWPEVREAVRMGTMRTTDAARLLGVSPSWVSRRVRAKPRDAEASRNGRPPATSPTNGEASPTDILR